MFPLAVNSGTPAKLIVTVTIGFSDAHKSRWTHQGDLHIKQQERGDLEYAYPPTVVQNIRNKNHETQQGLSGEIKALSGCGVSFERFSFSPLSLHSLVINQLWALAPSCPTFLSIIESLSANVRQNILTLPLFSFGRVFYHSNCCWETVSLAKNSYWGHPPPILDCCPTIFTSLRSSPFLLMQGAVI